MRKRALPHSTMTNISMDKWRKLWFDISSICCYVLLGYMTFLRFSSQGIKFFNLFRFVEKSRLKWTLVQNLLSVLLQINISSIKFHISLIQLHISLIQISLIQSNRTYFLFKCHIFKGTVRALNSTNDELYLSLIEVKICSFIWR